MLFRHNDKIMIVKKYLGKGKAMFLLVYIIMQFCNFSHQSSSYSQHIMLSCINILSEASKRNTV